MSNGSEFKYFAFISYSHRDTSFAKKLHQKLESYNISSVVETDNKKQKLYPVCRDETAFSTGNLDEIIKEKLKESKKLIVICTKAAAQSEYVCEEVRFFAENFGRENIVPVIAEKYCSEEERISLLPGILKETATEILDIYRFEDSYKSMFLKIVSGVLDISFETVAKRDAAMIKKRIILRSVSALAALLLLSVAMLFGVRFFKAGMISRDVKAAKSLCEQQLYEGLSQLLRQGEEAKKWHLDTDEVCNAVRESINYEKGAILKKCIGEEGTDFENAIISERKFVDRDKTMICYEGNILNVHDMSPVLKTNKNEFTYLGESGEINFNAEGFVSASIYYCNKRNKFYILMQNNDGKYKLTVFDTAMGKAENIGEVSSGFLNLTKGEDYFYYTDGEEVKRFNPDTYEISKAGEYRAPYAVSKEGKLISAYVENDADVFLSPDEKVLFVCVYGEKLYAYNTKDMSILYSFDIPAVVCDMAFLGENAVIYSNLSEEHVLYPANMFYINFNISDGNIISERKISYVRYEYFPDADYINHFLDVSDGGKTLLYNVSKNVVLLENTEKDDFQEFEFESEIINLAFYGDGDLFRVFLLTGEVYTIAAKANGGIRDMRCSEAICDRNNINNILIAEGNLLAKPIKYGSDYMVLFEAEGQVIFTGQTKNYFIFRSLPDYGDKIKYYTCKKDTYEVTEFINADFLEVYSNLWNYDENIVYETQNKKLFDLDTGKFYEDEDGKESYLWTKITDKYYVKVSREGKGVTAYFAENVSGEWKKGILLQDNSERTWYNIKKGSDAFVLYNGETVIKYNLEGKEISRIAINTGSKLRTAGYLIGEGTVRFDKTLSKICYTDTEKNAFIVADTESGKPLYSFRFGEKCASPLISGKDEYEYIALFSESGESVFVTYSDTEEEVCKTNLIDIKSGNVIDSFEGYPIIFSEYFTDTVLINKGYKNVAGFGKRLEEKYNIYTVAPIFSGYSDMKDKVQKFFKFIDR